MLPLRSIVLGRLTAPGHDRDGSAQARIATRLPAGRPIPSAIRHPRRQLVIDRMEDFRALDPFFRIIEEGCEDMPTGSTSLTFWPKTSSSTS
jgi:hypothetical protein